MSTLPPPVVLINGTPIVPEDESHALNRVAVLDGLTIVSGGEDILADPEPATCTFSVRYATGVDVLQIRQGDHVDVQQDHAEGMRSAFSGRVRSMKATTDDRGRLLLSVTATDHLADLAGHYVQTAWHSDDKDQAGGVTVRQQLQSTLTAEGINTSGWSTLPPELGPSKATFYTSITLMTLLRRYLAQWGPEATLWDSSYWQGPPAVNQGHIRRVSIGWADPTAGGDVLTAAADGTWQIKYGTPPTAIGTTIDARLVRREVDWDSSPESLVTGATIQGQVTRREDRDDGTSQFVTSLEDHHYIRSAAMVARYGRRPISVETMTAAGNGVDPKPVHREIARRWMAATGDTWRPSALTITNSDALDDKALSDLIGTSSRHRRWIVVPGVQVPTPRGAPASLRGIATGCELTWDGRRGRWNIALSISDTTATVAPDWKFTDLAAKDRRFSAAPAERAGNVSFSAFTTITKIGA